MSSIPHDTTAEPTGLEIAVIGMAGRFPSAQGLDEFWQLLREGREGLRWLTDEELDEAGVPPETRELGHYVRKRGVLQRKREFDAPLLGYTASEAATMDPQFAVLHEVAWEALEHAGYHGSKYEGQIGMFAGASPNAAWLQRVMDANGSIADYYSVSSLTDAGYLSTRVAHKLDLTGPALTTNTTCSTALVNIHLACQALITGDCDIALAGGVSVSIDTKGYLHQSEMVLSPDGSCRPFDAKANGTGSGEGCGLLVLKRLQDAIDDNDQVLAVVKGSAINNDGRRKVGFTAPSVEGQASVIRSAQARAEVEPGSIGYIEAHGTATKLGDPIEVSALKQVFAGVPPATTAIGSVKSNIGHLGEAAGVAGAIKAVLALYHREIPPSLNFTSVNPMIGLEGSPFFVNTETRAWQRDGSKPRRAGVSSFGIGGTNAHLVLEESTHRHAGSPGRSHQLVCLSAQTATALQAMERRLAAHAHANPGIDAADLCFTLHLGRKDLPVREAFVIEGTADLAARHAGTAASLGAVQGQAEQNPPRLCFMFPGQGAQYRGMAQQLYRDEAVFRQAMDECFAVAQRHGVDLRAQVYPERADAGDELLQTEFVQPALFAVEYALAQQLLHWGCKPQAYVGHSVGEYVAACLAGVFSLQDALALVIERGRIMQMLPPGAMLAVSLGEQALRELMPEGLDVAALNSPTRSVVAGELELVAGFRATLQARQVDCVPLRTSHAFHSRHLDALLPRFEAVVRAARLSAPHTPFASNLTGRWIEPQQATSPDYWVQQMRSAVRFADCVATLCQDAPALLLEVGPGAALGAFAMQCSADAYARQCVSLLPSARDSASAHETSRVLEGLGRLFVAGVAIDWRRFYEGQRRCRIALPTYPFEGHCHYPEHVLRRSPARHVAAAEAPAAPPDVAALPAVDPGLTPVQAQLVAIWKKYLGVAQVPVDQDVFDLGVDSLLSIRVITEIRETFKTDIALDAIFVLRTVSEQAAEIERRLDAHESTSIPPIVPRGHGGVAPLSTSQRRLWIISHLERNHTAYNTGFSDFVKGLDLRVLERTFRALIERHAILRTVYAEIDGEPVQRIREEFEFHIEEGDISHLPEAERYREGERLWQAALLSPIDLRSDVMVRAAAIKYGPDTHLLMVTQHHICSDNWSTNLLMQEMTVIYQAFLEGRENPLPPLPLQYIDYALWQNDWLRSDVLKEQLPYWKKTLVGAPQVHNLPLDRPRGKFQSYLGTQYSVKVEGQVLEGLQRLAQQNGATLFMTMQAAFALFLARYSGESDIVVGFSVANRLQRELEGLIGFFVNTLVLRSDLSGNPTFTDFLEQTKRSLLAAYAHQHVPFEVLVEELKPARSMSYEPVTQIKLVYLDQSQDQGGKRVPREFTGNDAVKHADMQVPFSKYDLTLYFNVVDGALQFAWEYATDLFLPETIRRMAANFETLLRGIVATPQRPVQLLPLVSEAEVRQQLRFGNARADTLLPAAAAPLPRHNPPQGDANEQFAFSLFYFASDDGGKSADKYRLLIEGARFADRAGFEAVWTPERHFDHFGGAYPNPAITAAALASMTSRLKIRAGSCVLPLHNPVRVAEDWSVIDNLSGGRVGVGFAAGFSARDFILAPHNFERRREVLMRDVQTVKALWRGDSVRLPNGQGEPTEIRIRPRPVQDELPVWVTTVGNDEAFRHAGRMGDNILTHLMGQSLEELSRKVKLYREEWHAAGHAGHGTITLLVHTFIADTEDLIFKSVKEPFKKYLVDSVGTPQTIAKTLGLGDLALAAGNDSAQGNSDVDAITEYAFSRYYQSNALFGTPERCLPLVDAIRAAGVNELACLVDFGVEPELVLQALPRLQQLRDLAIPEQAAKAEDFDTGEGEVPSGECIHRVFEQRAAETPDAPAISCNGTTLSYGELNARANRVAHALLTRYGVLPEDRVALCTSRSVDMLVGLMAILKAGAAYVPMEPSTPAARIGHMLSDAGIRLVLTRTDDRASLDGLPTIQLLLDELAAVEDLPASDPATSVTPGHSAYVIYTSGSSGAPKGVVVEHRSATNFWRVMQASTHRDCPRGANVALNASFAFDMSLKGILQLLSGHCLHLIPQEIRSDGARLLRFLEEHRINAVDSTPSQLNVILAAGLLEPRGHRPTAVLLGGEPINGAVWDQLKGCGHIAFFNMYGPTEATVDATIGRIAPEDAAPHIGRPIANAQIYLLDAHRQPVPMGAPGEIYIGGTGVARGYLNRPELTRERFIPDPFSKQPGARLYKTGDLGCWQPDGTIAFLGRNDSQVKLRGFRIELGEIEAALTQHPAVRQAAVMAVGEGAAKYLVAHVVPAQDEFDENRLIFELKRTLTAALPAYMVPQAFVLMQELPVNANGKLDRKLLDKAIFARPQRDHVAPRTETEKALAQIWQQVIGVQQVGVNDNFFEIGGHSLVAIRVANAIVERFGLDLQTRLLFEYDTIEALAACIDNLQWVRAGSTVDGSPTSDNEVELEI